MIYEYRYFRKPTFMCFTHERYEDILDKWWLTIGGCGLLGIIAIHAELGILFPTIFFK